jgi:hypothetical protein
VIKGKPCDKESIFLMVANFIFNHSKIIRRDIKRIHAELDNARRLSQAIENSIRDSREKLLSLEHKLDFKVGLEYQLQEYKEQLEEHTKSHEVTIIRTVFTYHILTIVLFQSYDADIEPLKKQVQETSQKYDEAVKAWRVTEEAASKEERIQSRIVERLEEFNNSIAK